MKRENRRMTIALISLVKTDHNFCHCNVKKLFSRQDASCTDPRVSVYVSLHVFSHEKLRI